jgi:NitT/TauT family transport system permease protein
MTIRRPISPSTSLVLGILSVLVLLGAYTWLAWRQERQNPDDTTIPRWSQLAKGFTSTVEVNRRSNDRWLVVDSIASAKRLFSGLFFGVTGGLLIGLAMGCLTPVEACLSPPMSLLAKIPPTAALAVFFVLVGTGDGMYVAMIAIGILPALAVGVHLAVREFPDELLYKAYTLGASPLEVVWTIIFPHVLPKFIDAVRLSIGPAMVYLIAAEMVVGDVGFGYRIRLQSKLLNMSVVYPYLAVLAGFGFGMDYLLRQIQRRLCPWFEGGR